MIPILSSNDYLHRMLELSRPGSDDILAFYEHRIGAICTDPKLMVMPWDDHLVHRGDGVFESLKYEERKLYQLDPHLDRMKKSADSIFMAPPCSWEEIREIAIQVAKAAVATSGNENGMLRILLGRGPGGFGIDPRECPQTSLYIAVYSLKKMSEERYQKGLTACRSSIPAKQSYMAKIKSLNYLPNMLIKREAIEKGYDLAFCFDRFDALAEGAVENVMIVDQTGTLVVPELTNALTGTTLMRALDLVAGDIPVTFRAIREGDIYDAKEVMIIGTTHDCVSVVRYEGKPIHDVRPGPVNALIRERIHKDMLENGLPL